jgi:hypothetical protein
VHGLLDAIGRLVVVDGIYAGFFNGVRPTYTMVGWCCAARYLIETDAIAIQPA